MSLTEDILLEQRMQGYRRFVIRRRDDSSHRTTERVNPLDALKREKGTDLTPRSKEPRR